MASIVAAITGGMYPYIILKIGIGPGMSVVSAAIGYALMKAAQQRDFGLKENIWVQTVGTASSSAAFMCIVIAAMEMMGTPIEPWLIFTWIAASATLGVCGGAVIRPVFIEEEKLPYPDGQATHAAMDTLHEPTREGTSVLATLLSSSLIAGGISFLAKLDVFFKTKYMPFGQYSAYGMGFATMSFLPGIGMIIPFRVCLWMLISSLVTWMVIGPELVNNGTAMEIATVLGPGLVGAMEAKKYYAVVLQWTMWPATIVLVVGSLYTMLLKWKSVVRAFRSLQSLQLETHDGKSISLTFLGGVALLCTSILCAVQYYALGIAVWITLISVMLSMVLMVVCARVAGEAGLTPASAMGSSTQLVFAGLAPGDVTANLMTAGTATAVATEGCDLMFDAKTAKMGGLAPRHLLKAQFIGPTIGALMVAVMYPILTEQYELGSEDGLPAPTAVKWVGFAQVLTKGVSHLPSSIFWAMAGATLFALLITLVEQKLHSGKNDDDKERADTSPITNLLIPSVSGIGIGMLLPALYVLPVALGGVAGFVWELAHSASYQKFRIHVGAGLIAGGAFVSGLVIPVYDYFFAG